MSDEVKFEDLGEEAQEELSCGLGEDEPEEVDDEQ